MTEFGFWNGKRVLLTGHTGFKGAWLSLLLDELGAEVTGFALEPCTTPSLFDLANVETALKNDIRGDIRDLEALQSAVASARPDIAIHMAAQSLVTEGYADPVGTYEVNVMGTVNLLEALRQATELKAILVVTTDKCYENLEWVHPYRELDSMGGRDPYSSSKGCAELVTAAYRMSYFERLQPHVGVASARAGNVIGGGDWAPNRLVPDCIRAFARKDEVVLRNPNSVRPWQHVLDPLNGYLSLAKGLSEETTRDRCTGAWNFGPEASGEDSVMEVANAMALEWGSDATVTCDADSATHHEANVLRLDSTKARTKLGWKPRWNLQRGLQETAVWYRAWNACEDMRRFTMEQIAQFMTVRDEH